MIHLITPHDKNIESSFAAIPFFRLFSLLLFSYLGYSCAGQYRAEHKAPKTGETIIRLRWHKKLVHHSSFDRRAQEWASATFSSAKNIYIGSTGRRLWALTIDGKIRWKRDTIGAISSKPLYDKNLNTVFFGADDGYFYALNATNGEIKWKHKTKGLIRHRPAYTDGLILFTTSENRVYCLDASTGRWRWQYDREVPEGFTIFGYAGVLVVEGIAYTGFADGTAIGFKAPTGEILWKRNLATEQGRFADLDATPVYFQDVVLFSSYSTGLFALSPQTGSVVWSFSQPGITSISATLYGPLVVAPQKGIIALNSKGKERWRQSYPVGTPSSPLVVGDYIAVGGTESGLAIVSSKTGQLYQYFDPGYGISAKASYDASTKLLAVLSNRGHFYVFDVLR